MISLRHNANSANTVTLSDYFTNGETCGLERLSDITAGNYRSIQGSQTCTDPWRLDPAQSAFTANSFTTATNRDIIYVGSSSISVGDSVTFRCGFNTFGSSIDTERNEFGHSADLTMLVLDKSDSHAAPLAPAAAVLVLLLVSSVLV